MMLLLPFVTVALLIAALATGRWVAITALVAIGLIYVATLGVISLDPYFEDNGSREFIAWRYRWIWAAEIAGWLSMLGVPLVLMLTAAVRGALAARRRRRGG